MSKTKIEWTNETLNIITGCSKVSEGCYNCYAEKMHKRLSSMGQEKYKMPFKIPVFHREELEKFNSLKKNTLVFLNSMSDTFNYCIKNAQIKEILVKCASRIPFNQFQILTKRAERLPIFEYPENVWLGVTVENKENKKRIDYLKQTNAKIKFLSCEPLLEDLGELDLTDIDWVIVGGESGTMARPMHPDWVRNILKQCEEQNIAFYFKQWGSWKLIYERDKAGTTYNYFNDSETDLYNLTYKKNYTRLNFAGGFGFHGDNVCYYKKTSKKEAGSMLDDRVYKEYPKYSYFEREVEK